MRCSCIVQVQFSIVQHSLLHTTGHTVGHLQYTHNTEITQTIVIPFLTTVTPSKHERLYVKIYFNLFFCKKPVFIETCLLWHCVVVIFILNIMYCDNIYKYHDAIFLASLPPLCISSCSFNRRLQLQKVSQQNSLMFLNSCTNSLILVKDQFRKQINTNVSNSLGCISYWQSAHVELPFHIQTLAFNGFSLRLSSINTDQYVLLTEVSPHLCTCKYTHIKHPINHAL